MKVEITIPWEHVASSNQRNKRKGGKAHGWGYKQARQAIHLHAVDQYRGERPAFPKGTKVRVRMNFYMPDFRHRDPANYLKALLDGLQGVVYADDWQVVDLSFLRRQPDADNPRVDLTVEAT